MDIRWGKSLITLIIHNSHYSPSQADYSDIDIVFDQYILQLWTGLLVPSLRAHQARGALSLDEGYYASLCFDSVIPSLLVDFLKHNLKIQVILLL